MIDGIDPQGQQFLAALDVLQQRAATAQQQISSGSRVSSAADAPGDIGEILGIDSNLKASEQVSANLGRVKSEVDTAESSIQSAVLILQQAQTIGAQGGSNLDSTVAQRPVLAEQIQHLQEQLVAIAGTTVEGRYIFSGDADGAAAYAVNLSSANGVDRLSTASATRQVQSPDGTSFSVAQTAGNIFDHRNPDDSMANDNVFLALNSLRLALLANDTAAITTAVSRLTGSADYLNQRLAAYGTAQTQVAAAIDSAEKLQTRWTVRLSDLRDTDQTSAILQLTQAQTGAQAAMSAQAQRPRTSLFDYLR
jgi:flagellar hook-associated protein 3 FlgL